MLHTCTTVTSGAVAFLTITLFFRNHKSLGKLCEADPNVSPESCYLSGFVSRLFSGSTILSRLHILKALLHLDAYYGYSADAGNPISQVMIAKLEYIILSF